MCFPLTPCHFNLLSVLPCVSLSLHGFCPWTRHTPVSVVRVVTGQGPVESELEVNKNSDTIIRVTKSLIFLVPNPFNLLNIFCLCDL